MDINAQAEVINRDIALENYRANVAEGAERLRFQVEYSQSSLKSLHLVNGGGIIALLTFLGNTSVDFYFPAIWWAFACFGFGLACSLAAFFGAFLSQHEFMNVTFKEAWNAQNQARGLQEHHDFSIEFKWGNRFLYFGIAAACLSLIFFVLGAFVALSGLR